MMKKYETGNAFSNQLSWRSRVVLQKLQKDEENLMDRLLGEKYERNYFKNLSFL